MIDTTITYLGLELPSPVIATASPVTSRIEGLVA
ncbi:MAG: dihydroorotate dehydrogenase, partial [Acidimicrobiia bacterium]|nr:dihydroorotate dehydrogenase [Acidimicrobiia bacterium]